MYRQLQHKVKGMYRQLQQKAKEYVVRQLNGICSNWMFKLDMKDANNPIIVGNGPEGVIIRSTIEELHSVMTSEMVNGVIIMCGAPYSTDINNWGGPIILSHLLNGVFNIYGINTTHKGIYCAIFWIKNKDATKNEPSYVYYISEQYEKIVHFVSPYRGDAFKEYVMKEKLISPILLLLDPLLYFKRYSNIIDKYPELDTAHTLGIYEILLEYFPEMEAELFVKYSLLYRVFLDICRDITFLVGTLLVDLDC